MRYTYPNVLDSPELLQKLVTLTVKLLRQAYHYFKLRKAFSKFYRRHCALVKNITSVCKKTLLQQGISEPDLYGDLLYKI